MPRSTISCILPWSRFQPTAPCSSRRNEGPVVVRCRRTAPVAPCPGNVFLLKHQRPLAGTGVDAHSCCRSTMGTALHAPNVIREHIVEGRGQDGRASSRSVAPLTPIGDAMPRPSATPAFPARRCCRELGAHAMEWHGPPVSDRGERENLVVRRTWSTRGLRHRLLRSTASIGRGLDGLELEPRPVVVKAAAASR
jgi:hypothetical protein